MFVFNRFTVIKVFICLGFVFLPLTNANAVTMLTLPGSFQPPGIAGTFDNDAEFSWIKHRFPSNEDYFSWNFGGGTDGGIIFDQPQEYGSLTDVFIMFNQQTAFYSVDSGLSIDLNNTIEMSNLRMQQSGDTIDIGSGSGFDTSVPFFSNISLLDADVNGWSIDNSGAYHLFYNTRGTCVDCEMTIHLYGMVVAPVPVPTAIWLFSSGLFALIGVSLRNKAG